MDTPSPSVDAHGTPEDAFDILRLEPRFELDGKLLAERHRTLSLALHPDRFAGRPSAERRLALERAMQVNAAYRALRDPIARAEVLALRLGIVLHGETMLNPDFLEQTMARREALAEAVFSGDRARVAELAEEGRMQQSLQCSRLSALLDGAERTTVDRAAHLAEAVSSLRFLRRFVESAEAELEAEPS